MKEIIGCLALVMVVVLLALTISDRRVQATKATGQVSLLDTPLLDWSPSDRLTVRTFLDGGVLVLGGPGSGKTSGSGEALSNAAIRNRHSCGLILAAKPEDAAAFRRQFAAAGREADLVEFSPSHPVRFNFLNYVHRCFAGSTREIVQCIMTIAETLRTGETASKGEDGEFWRQQTQRLFYHAVQIIKLATGKVGAPELQKFIIDAATTAEMVHSATWLAGYHHQMIHAAYEAREQSTVDAYDFEQAASFWLAEWPQMVDRTRSSIQASVMGILHVFNSGICRELISGETNLTPDDLLGGKWLLVNMPAPEFGEAGSFVNAGWKYLLQKRILQRHVAPDDRFAVIWCDEAQQYLNAFDGHFLAQCRSHRGCMVALTQSLHGLFALLKGDAGKQQALGLLACFHTRVFHALGSAEDAEFASDLIGKRRNIFIGGSMAPAESPHDALFGTGGFTGNFSQHEEAIIPPRMFLTGLRRGGPEARFVVDAIVVKSGEPFACGENWLKVSFQQQ